MRTDLKEYNAEYYQGIQSTAKRDILAAKAKSVQHNAALTKQ